MNKFKIINDESYGRIFNYPITENTAKSLEDFCAKHQDLKLHKDEDGVYWVHTLHEFQHYLRNQNEVEVS